MSFVLFFKIKIKTSSPGEDSEWVPPDTISNSVVKRLSADDSVRSPHVKVGHRQAFIFYHVVARKGVDGSTR